MTARKPDQSSTPLGVDTEDLGHSFPNWYMVEVRSPDESHEFDAESLKQELEQSALPLLRSPELAIRPLPDGELLASIDSPDAYIVMRVDDHGVSAIVHVVGDARAAARFSENICGLYGPEVRLRILPDGRVPSFGLSASGTIFGEVVTEVRSAHQIMTLARHPIYGRCLLLNGEIQVGADDETLFSGPLVSHAVPEGARRVLILGGGDCGVLREVLNRPVERVVMIELDKAVVQFCAEHLPHIVGEATADGRAEIRFQDAFRFLATTDERFDVVISDLPDAPISDLTIDDQVALMSRVLTADGVFATHAERYLYDDPTFRSERIVGAIARRFDNVEVVSQRIPSFQDLIWLFVRGTGRRRGAGE